MNNLFCTRDLVNLLDRNQEIFHIEEEIDPHLELAELQRQVVARKGPALLFHRVQGTKFPVATNLYGSAHRLELAFGRRPFELISQLADLAHNLMPPSFKKLWDARNLAMEGLKVGLKDSITGPVLRNSLGHVGELPQIKSWPEDGGAFITLPLVYTESPVTGKSNLGMYRVQLFEDNTAGMHIQIHRGGGFHLHEAKRLGQPLAARVFVGGPPALTIAAIAPLPEDIPELLFASLLMGEKLKTCRPDPLKIRTVIDADFALSGWIDPAATKPEGPFGDHYGYYSLQHDYPFLRVTSIYHRSRPIFPATVVGRPPQEDHYIAEFLQDILEPLFPLVMPNVKKVWAYEESGVHSMAAAIVKNRYHKEAFTAGLRVLSEGHLSLTKFLFVTDQEVDIKDFKQVLTAVLERTDLKRDLYVLSNTSQDTLDYTGPQVNEGSKAIWMGIGEPKNQLKRDWLGSFHHAGLKRAKLYCPGVLCVGGMPHDLYPDLGSQLAQEPDIKDFMLVVLVDDQEAAAKSTHDFIWHLFTRFEPAADLYGKQVVERFHLGIEGPLVIDARLKPWYPKVLEPDPVIAKKVEIKWGTVLDKIEARKKAR